MYSRQCPLFPVNIVWKEGSALGNEERERERERERRKKWGSSERHDILGSKKESIFPVLKVPRQCPLVLLVEAAHMIGIRFFTILFIY
jgi:hypothetical protein